MDESTLLKIAGVLLAIVVITQSGLLDVQTLLGNVRPTSQTFSEGLRHMTWVSNTGDALTPGGNIETQVSPPWTSFASPGSGFLRGTSGTAAEQRCKEYAPGANYDNNRGCWVSQGWWQSGYIHPKSSVKVSATTEYEDQLYPFSFTVDLANAEWNNGVLAFKVPECTPFGYKANFVVDFYSSDEPSPKSEFAEATCVVPNRTVDMVNERLNADTYREFFDDNGTLEIAFFEAKPVTQVYIPPTDIPRVSDESQTDSDGSETKISDDDLLLIGSLAAGLLLLLALQRR